MYDVVKGVIRRDYFNTIHVNDRVFISGADKDSYKGKGVSIPFGVSETGVLSRYGTVVYKNNRFITVRYDGKVGSNYDTDWSEAISLYDCVFVRKVG